MAGDPYIQSETMQFRDNVPGSLDERGSYSDPTRDLAMMSDATLGSWFSRPINIGEFTWNMNSPIFERFNPWTLFWENPRNLEKISNFHLLRCKLHVKFLINGNAFYYGRAIAAYEPLSPLDDTSPSREWVSPDFIRGSQRMHVYLNPTMSMGGSLELPFFWPKNNWIVSSNQWRDMGEIVIASLNDLKHANASTDPISITVLAWAEDVKFAIPSRTPPAPAGVSVPESGSPDEHESDVISRPASNVARIAGTLSDVPVIGPYAKATQIGASALSRAAKLFGMSAPNELHQEIFEPRAKHSLAVTDTKQSANKVTIDSKQEITIDPRTTGVDLGDELPIASIAGRESYLTTFGWDISDAAGTHLWNTRVDPGLKGRNGSEWHFPACALAALPFKYWRGTMRIRFQIVASEYHKGRLRISYDPRIGAGNSEFNTQYTTIHDIAENKDFTVDVGWAQDTPYKESLGWYSSPEFGTTPLTINILQGNGVLTVNVLNKLSAPAVSNDPISINVFISMLEDFEVAVPDEKMSFTKFRPNQDPPPASPEAGLPDIDDQDTPITDPEPVNRLAHTELDEPNTTMVFMGESIASFRSLLKRSYLSEYRNLTEVLLTHMLRISRSSFPTYGGFVSGPIGPASMVQTFGDGRLYNPVTTTLMNYLGRAFLGWRGSTRWTLDAGSLPVSGTTSNGRTDVWNSVSFGLSRDNRYELNQEITPWDIFNPVQNFTGFVRGNDVRGMYLGNTNVNPVQTLEVPYLENKRFSYTFKDENFSVSTNDPGFRIHMILPNSETLTDTSFITLYVSAGEDFNFFFYNGLPPVYYEQAYATDPVG